MPQPDPRILADALVARIEAAMDLFCAQGACLTDNLADGHPTAVDYALYYYRRRKFIQWADEKTKGKAPQDAVRIPESRRNALDYYKNISICHFIPPAFTAMAILEKDAFQFSAADLHDTYRRLQELFAEEFNPDPDHPPAYIVRKTVKAFIDNAILALNESGKTHRELRLSTRAIGDGVANEIIVDEGTLEFFNSDNYLGNITLTGGHISTTGGTRPWRTVGEGDTIRYTAKNDAVYATVLGWPGQTVTLKTPKSSGATTVSPRKTRRSASMVASER